MTTSITSTFATTTPPEMPTLLTKPRHSACNTSDSTSESTAATSGSISSADQQFDSPGEKKLAQTPPYAYIAVTDPTVSTGESKLALNRQNSGSLPDFRKAELQTEEGMFDMSDFGCGGDFYHQVDVSEHVRKPLPEVPEETDTLNIGTPPSCLYQTGQFESNVVISPALIGTSPMGPSSIASSSSTAQSMELHAAQPLLYSAIGSLERGGDSNTAAFRNRYVKSSAREFRSSEVTHVTQPARRQKNRLSTATLVSHGSSGKPVSQDARKDGNKPQSDRPFTATKSVLRKKEHDPSTKEKALQSKVDFEDPGSGGSGSNKKDKVRKKEKRVTINQQTEEMFLPVSEAFTPRVKKEIKYKPAEMRTPVQSMSSKIGTLSRPNFRDALRRVAMIIRQHIEKIERRFETSVPKETEGLFSPSMRDLFSDEQFVTPRYKCTMVRVPMARPSTVFGLRKIRLNFSIPTEEEIYEFGHQLFNSVQLSSECSIVCLIYVERLMEVAKVPLVSCTWRPIFMCGLLLASKVWQDLASWNIEFAAVYPQYSLDAINRLELLFLRMIKWDLYISSR